MATYLPPQTTITPKQKLLPPRVEIIGQPRLDLGQGTVNMEAVGLLVDDQDPPQPILDADGKEQFRGTGMLVSKPLSEVLDKSYTCLGEEVSGQQVMEFIGQLFDELIAETQE